MWSCGVHEGNEVLWAKWDARILVGFVSNFHITWKSVNIEYVGGWCGINATRKCSRRRGSTMCRSSCSMGYGSKCHRDVTDMIHVVSIVCCVVEEVVAVDVNDEFLTRSASNQGTGSTFSDEFVDDLFEFVGSNATSRVVRIGPTNWHVKDKCGEVTLVVGASALPFE